MNIDDGLAFVGFVLLVVGIGLMHVPAAMIVAGILLLAVGVLRSRAVARGEVLHEQREHE